ncbi:hypothetical protein WAI453_002208 [Rhynchosporium graminicola]
MSTFAYTKEEKLPVTLDPASLKQISTTSPRTKMSGMAVSMLGPAIIGKN